MDWLLFAFALELGAIRGIDIPVDLSSYVQTEATVTMLRHLEIGGSLRSYQVPGATWNDWAPFRMDYSVTASVRLGDFVLGAQHECDHPVDSPGAPRSERSSVERLFVRITTPRTRP